MSVPFVTRPPTRQEIERIRLAMSTFCDGSGQEREGQSTRPGWRDFERLIASVLGGQAVENKDVFDVVVPSTADTGIDYGISIKSKELSRSTALSDLESGGRVYMELSNSPAKFWDALRPKGIDEGYFHRRQKADVIGQTIIDVVTQWHQDAKMAHGIRNPGRRLDLHKSKYLTISYSPPRPNRQYQIHSFCLEFASGINWQFHSSRCLRGYDPQSPAEPLMDWYALSGGQLKYYPRAIDCAYSSGRFELEVPPTYSVPYKAARYWPIKWVRAGGRNEYSLRLFIEEIERLSSLLQEDSAKKSALDFAKKLQDSEKRKA